jgi:DNA modification methylase/uncharacterized CHY-type Zn-finger protein
MNQESEKSSLDRKRKELPIERGYPIEQVNEIVERENRAKRHYRPLYTMHKWWARRLGSVFRTIALYSLIDNPSDVNIENPGEKGDLDDFLGNTSEIDELISQVDIENPDTLWRLYNKDVQVKNKSVLDPFMGGGTSLIEASRLGADIVGSDLNPVAWFVTKKELEAGKSDLEELETAFNEVQSRISDELTDHYVTDCPNCHETADVMYYLWVNELDCVSCNKTVSLFKDYRVAKGRYSDKGKYNVLCPKCESVVLVDDWRSDSSCGECGNVFTPKNGTVGSGDYSCHSCGQRYGIMDGGQEQGGYKPRMYAIEYYCPHCEEKGADREVYKGYKSVQQDDIQRYNQAKQEWENNPQLREYVPAQEVPLGILTDSTAFEGSIGGGHNLLGHGYDKWEQLFNDRQLLCLSKLLKAIDEVENQEAKEYLLLAFSDSLMFNNTFTIYNVQRHSTEGIFKTNSFKPQKAFVENNVWGTEYGRGTFRKSFKKALNGVEWAIKPVERYIEDGSTKKTESFSQPVGHDNKVICGDARELNYENEFDAVLTDPPYYNNVIYSELSNFFYVWLRLVLESEYEYFESDTTPRAESIVTNPAEGKDDEDFERELREAFGIINDALVDDGVLAFTYHHSGSESWGELLQAVCDVGFEITATYPITADTNRATYKLTEGESVSFDIIIVARPLEETEPASWNTLRRDIYRTARQTRRRLESSERELSRGDIGVIEMGKCFQQYSKHHDKVQRDGEIISAKEVVQEIYGIIQEASDIGGEDVFIDLLDTPNPSYDDVNKLCRGTNASPEDLKAKCLYNQDDGFELGTWDNKKRQAYIQERTNGDRDDHLSNLDKLQFLRYRYEKGQAVQNYVSKWGVDDDLRELAGRLADVTGDDTYTRVLGDRDITSY